MITVNEILNKVLPLTKEDNQCGFKKAKKMRARNELIVLLNKHKNGEPVILPEWLSDMLNQLK